MISSCNRTDEIQTSQVNVPSNEDQDQSSPVVTEQTRFKQRAINCSCNRTEEIQTANINVPSTRIKIKDKRNIKVEFENKESVNSISQFVLLRGLTKCSVKKLPP